MFGKPILGVAGLAALAVACAFHEGVVRVSVDKHKPGGHNTRFDLLVPAALVPVAFLIAPEDRLRRAAERAHPWLPALGAASAELAREADVDLIEVRSCVESVRIAKRRDSLVIDVDSPGEKVHASIPLRTLRDLARKLETYSPTL